MNQFSITVLRLSGVLFACLAIGACQPETTVVDQGAAEQQAEPTGETRVDSTPTYRVAVMRFQQETCTFCLGGDAPTEDWTVLGPLLSGGALLQSGNYLRGFTQQARDYGDIELITLTSPGSLFGGSSRSWSTEESFNTFMDQMIAELRAAGPVDGLYMAVHGALAVRNIPRPEAEMARRFREVVGPEVPIAASFDLHGNEDEEFMRWADFSMVTKRYPHYDAYLQGQRAARALHMTMAGDYVPTTATRNTGILTPTVVQWTGAGSSSMIMERARRWEVREPGVFVSVFYGFPWSDVPDLGATIHVMTNNDQALADEIAKDMDDFFWRVRDDFVNINIPYADTAAQQVVEAIANGEVPIAVGDYSDRPGDATHITRAFDAAGIGNVIYGAITSPDTLERMRSSELQVGDSFDDLVGGYTESGGNPVRIQGRVEYVGPWRSYDYVGVVSYGDNNLVYIVPAYTQITDPNSFAVGSIDPNDYDVFVVKSRVHFRRGFDETGFAEFITLVQAPEPYFGTTFLDALEYENIDINNFYPYGTPAHRR